MSESRRHPQGEDHKAGKALLAFIRENKAWFCGGRMVEPYESQAIEKLNAYLSRVSPSRDGTVAVEDVRLARALDFIRGVARLEHVSAADRAVNAIGKDAREFLEFLPLPATGMRRRDG